MCVYSCSGSELYSAPLPVQAWLVIQLIAQVAAKFCLFFYLSLAVAVSLFPFLQYIQGVAMHSYRFHQGFQTFLWAFCILTHYEIFLFFTWNCRLWSSMSPVYVRWQHIRWVVIFGGKCVLYRWNQDESIEPCGPVSSDDSLWAGFSAVLLPQHQHLVVKLAFISSAVASVSHDFMLCCACQLQIYWQWESVMMIITLSSSWWVRFAWGKSCPSKAIAAVTVIHRLYM